jgi:hypothetical protein
MVRIFVVAFCLTLLAAEPRQSQRVLPRPEPVAETRLLMDGIADANFQGLAKLLKDKPDSTEGWTFARGQALLIAETGNLLMIRPPSVGRAAWLDNAAALRTKAVDLARATAQRDLPRSRSLLNDLATSCNRCHETFRVEVRISAAGAKDRRSSPPAP